MGITVHYAGTAKSEESIVELFQFSRSYAQNMGWEISEPEEESIREHGIALWPHQDCEPISLWFTRTRRIAELCKTQFAGPVVHVAVLGFLQAIEPFFSKFILFDEAAEQCDVTNPDALAAHFDEQFRYIEEGMLENPGSEMKVNLDNGRIADIVA